MDKLKNLLLYGDTDRETFHGVEPELLEGNQKGLCAYSLLAAVGMICMAISTYFADSLVKNRTLYFTAALLNGGIYLLMKSPWKKKKCVVYLCVYAFMGMLFVFGILLGTVINPKIISVSFPVLLFAVPLLFVDAPARMCLIILISIITYLAAAARTQDPVVFGYNISNVIPYGAISMAVCVIIMRTKIGRYVLEQENQFLSERDQLTGLLNRRSYDQLLARIRANEEKPIFMICTMDINGLKPVNDHLGHLAGDELIRGAAHCIEAVLGNYGKCYRIGGDEFTAILQIPSPEPEELIRELNARAQCWKGTLVSGMSISTGIAVYEDGISIAEMIRLADKRMYEYKENYYTQTGEKRRSR